MSRGDDLLKQADKKANSSGGWFSSASSKWEDASELYKQVSVTDGARARAPARAVQLWHRLPS
jgi:hypothetical protein